MKAENLITEEQEKNRERVARRWREVAYRQERIASRYKNFKIKSISSQKNIKKYNPI